MKKFLLFLLSLYSLGSFSQEGEVPDNSFGTNGKTIIDMNSGSDDACGTIASQGTKKIVGVMHYDIAGNEIPSHSRLNNSAAFYNSIACVTPAAPTITLSGNTLTSSSAVNNQWYINGVAIGGATNQTYVATVSGTYTATVTENGCTSLASNAITVTVTGINSPALDLKIRMAPNPVSGKMTISYSGTARLTMGVFDLSGRNVMNSQSFSSGLELDLSGYAKGSYIVRITNELTGERLQKLVMKQ